MGSSVYFNDNEPYVAEWLRNLYPEATVDSRSVLELKPEDLTATRNHFFAGIGGWQLALDMAGWGDTPVWTASLPCQPFSTAGKRRGEDDERHLWPHFYELVRQCKPPVIFGEQVASAEVVGHVGKGSRVPAAIQETQSRSRFDAARSIQGNEAGRTFRSGSVAPRTSEEARLGSVRDLRDALQLGRREDLGQSVIRPDQSGWGLPVLEHPGSNSRSEQRDGRLGRGEDARDRPFDPEQANRNLQRAIGEAWAEFDEAVGFQWLSGIQADLESIGYTVGACVLPAAGIGAPHIRQRLYWVAYANSGQRGRLSDTASGHIIDGQETGWQQSDSEPEPRSATGRLAYAERDPGISGRTPVESGEGAGVPCTGAHAEPGRRGNTGGLGDSGDQGSQGWFLRRDGTSECLARADGPGPWSRFDLIECADGKVRRIPTEPELFPLAYGVPAITGKLRAAGNAVVPPLAAEFIGAFMESVINLT